MICASCHRTAKDGERSCRSCGAALEGLRTQRRRPHDRLSHETREALAAAAVIGDAFALNVLERVLRCDRASVIARLDEAIAAGIVTTADGVARDRFRDPATRSALLAGMSQAQRAALHRRVGDALVELHGASEAHDAAIAAQYLAAATDGDVAKAVLFCTRAGERAQGAGRLDDAARHYQGALDALESARCCDDGARADLFAQLADVLEDVGQRREQARRGLELARSIDAAKPFARCVLAFAGSPQPFRDVVCDQRVVALLEEALARLGAEESAQRARILARLAEELTFSDQPERMEDVAGQALALARRLPDRAVLAYVLRTTHWALWSPGNPTDRIALANQIRSHNAASGEPVQELDLDAHLFRLWALIELGDVPAAREELAGCARLAEALRLPYQRWLVATTRVCLAFTRGDLESVDDLAQQAFEGGTALGSPNAALFFGIQRTYLAWLRGDLNDAEQALQLIGDNHPLLTLAVHAALAATYGELGRLDDARRELELVTARGLDALPRNLTWIMTMSFLAEACTRLGERSLAAALYQRLEPYDNRNVLLVPVTSFGAAAHFLGMLATTLERWDVAQRHFERALALQRWMHGRHLIARTQVAYASMLLQRGHDEDRTRATALLEEARVIASELGMRTVVAGAEKLLEARSMAAAAGAQAAAVVVGALDEHASSPAAAGQSDAEISSGSTVGRFVRAGDYFTIDFAGRTIHHRSSKGHRHLALLLRHPGRELHVLDMARICEGTDPDARPSIAAGRKSEQLHRFGSGDALSDRRARDEFRAEFRELERDLEGARKDNDLGRIERLEAERDGLLAHVRSLTTPRGADRRFASAEERARQAIKKTLAAALKRIRADHSALGRHLDTCLSTGVRCSYAPRDPSISWEVEL
jgi:tetratricopeptide (TPR) repeat protein